MAYLLIAIVIIILIVGAIASFIKWLSESTNKFAARIAVDKNKKIYDRNKEMIQTYLNSIDGSNRSYFIENKVRDCIRDIALKEGMPDLAPTYREWLFQWQERKNIPHEYIELKDYLKQLFSIKNTELISKQRMDQEDREKRKKETIASLCDNLFERNKDLVDKFLQIAERKVSIIDDYGDENWKIFPDEIQICLKKIAQRENTDINWKGYSKGRYSLPDEYVWLQDKLINVFREYHDAQQSKEASSHNLDNMSGVEFETWIVKLLKENEFDDVSGTSATGDQGADIIAKKNGKNIIIQAKRHRGPVGNKAVQEVIGALQYYGGDEGWVITNSTFTTSAKALAQKSMIKLIDGNSLTHFKDFIN